MKVRTGFVSNSSSSSFICDVCNDNVSGMDMSLSEAGMFECDNGHVVCDTGHGVSPFEAQDVETMRAVLVKKYADDDEFDYINMEESDIEEHYIDVIDDARYEIPVEFCPCCNLSEPSDEQLLEYLLYKANITKNKVVKNMQEEFSTYDEMNKMLKGK